MRTIKSNLPIDEAIYNEGFESGVRSAALTWEDMKAIDYIMNEVDFLNMQAESVGKELPYPDDEAFYGEILRRFNEKREKK